MFELGCLHPPGWPRDELGAGLASLWISGVARFVARNDGALTSPSEHREPRDVHE